MKENNQDPDKLINHFFQTQKKVERSEVPPFSKTFLGAQKRIRTQKRVKIAFIAAAISILAVISFAVHDDILPANMGNITIAKGSMSLYKILMADGKIVTNDIHFEYDRALIKTTSIPILRSLAKMLEEHKKVHLHIEGHTDNTGDSLYNQKLSFARANEVRRALIKFGISADRLTAEGLGESKPAYENKTEKGRALNRRVAFVLVH